MCLGAYAFLFKNNCFSTVRRGQTPTVSLPQWAPCGALRGLFFKIGIITRGNNLPQHLPVNHLVKHKDLQ